MTILIVDDVEIDGLFLSSLIANQGHDVVTVDNALTGLHGADVHNPSLIMVDYMMPDLDGLEFIRRVRAGGRHGATPIVMMSANRRRELRLAALEAGATDFLVKPVNPRECKARIGNLLRLADATRIISETATVLQENVSRAMASIAERGVEMIVRLSRAAEFRDPDAAQHVKRAAAMAQRVARTMGFGDSFCSRIYLAMQMHDVGKLGVSETILGKPGPLTAEERSAMEMHVVYGSDILKGSASDLMQMGEEIALSHHERWDGSGYPNGLAGAEIPLSGRIAAVADVFDALTSWRPYKAAWTRQHALDHLRQEAGRLFDSACVHALVQVVETAPCDHI